MITLDIRHPDIENFVTMKHDLSKVTGANISVKISDEFMKAVENKESFTLKFPVDSNEPKVTKEIDANSLWQLIVDSATKTAEPGLMMWDTITKNLPAHEYAEEGFNTVTTNPCIIGDTLIATADGRNAVAIRQLAEEGRDIPVYSTDIKTGQVQIKMGRNPRKTGTKREVWRLTLDDGSSLVATPEHKVLTKELKYVSLRDLVPGQSIFPFYSFESNRYRQIANVGAEMMGGAHRNRRQYRVIHEHHHGIVDAKRYAIHHVDFNSKNDRIENLEVMSHEEHRRLHADKIMGKDNPYHKMTDEWKWNFASHPGETNPKFSGRSNEEILEAGKRLFSKRGKITKRMWSAYAKENGYPQHLGNNFRFSSFSNFKNQVSENHKVASIEFVGYEDVYNITVDDNHNYHIITSTEDEEYITSSGICIKNCGEIPLSPHDSCRLIAINLVNFVEEPYTNKAFFNFEKFNSYTSKAMRLSDDLVELEIEKLHAILEKVDTEDEKELWNKLLKACSTGRRTGLGTLGLGDTLCRLGLVYGSKESVEMIDSIYESFKISAYQESIELAKERGSFSVFDWSKEKNNDYIKSLPPELKNKMAKNGRRNISILTNAPTGTCSIAAQTSSGIEPIFRVSYTRRKKINHSDTKIKADFIDDLGDRWQEFEVYHHEVKNYWNIAGNCDVSDLPDYFVSSDQIDWNGRINVQAAIQKHIDHSISSTINLPAGTKSSVVGKLYMDAWKNGLKGVTIYVDGSRTGVLVTNEEKNENKNSLDAAQHAQKRLDTLRCEIHRAKIKGEDWTILVGIVDGYPYEIFGGLSEYVEIPRKYTSGRITKRPRKTMANKYDLTIGDGEDEFAIKDIAKVFDNPNHTSFTRTISLALRHKVPLQFLVEQLQKDKEANMFSFSRVVARCLKKYIADGTKVSNGIIDCNCESPDQCEVVYQEGCATCLTCGFAKCG